MTKEEILANLIKTEILLKKNVEKIVFVTDDDEFEDYEIYLDKEMITEVILFIKDKLEKKLNEVTYSSYYTDRRLR